MLDLIKVRAWSWIREKVEGYIFHIWNDIGILWIVFYNVKEHNVFLEGLEYPLYSSLMLFLFLWLMKKKFRTI